MEIELNERSFDVVEGTSLDALRDAERPQADIVILNGAAMAADATLSSGDEVCLIQRGVARSEDELEALMAARHTPGVHTKVKAATVGIAGQVTTIIPGKSPCLSCIYPEGPTHWKREFPLLGTVSSMAASIAAVEGIKLICGLGETLAGTILYYDSRNMNF